MLINATVSIHKQGIHASTLHLQVGIDLIGPFFKSRSGNRYIITLVDYFSKWPEAAAIPSKEAKEVAFFLFKMICRYI